ncbi:hypothetical protein DB32_002439 [Sandaracinus amylolyticus]|uniref:Tetratricopeptide repeat protein n=2 Tax=Sandaracinus amylolyticus TaxID=927083 RepID=A0A0F6W214_9BACT|nr:hypothetical protein DB32_002439 [Sandaracinus amylolyticus]
MKHERAFRLPSPLIAFAIALASVFAISAPAHAQRALQQVLDLNRQAMEAYNNLEIEQANTLLNQALQAAQRGRVTGAPLARTYMNLGVVAIGGLGDNGAGLNYFTQALQADPNVQLDPLTSTPDIQTTFALARQRAGAGGGGGGGQVEVPPPDPSGGEGGGGGGGGAPGNLTHAPVPEQLAQTAVPVYIEVPGRPAHVYLYYRAHGMREFQRVDMQRVAGGYGYEIPCTDVFEPEIAYYVVAFGTDGSPVGFAGAQATPITVPIVASRSQPAPALPGRAPPTQCQESECPPGMAGCDSGGRALGDSCTSDSQCTSGNCEDDLCAPSDGGGGGGGGGGGSGAPRFFARIGGGLGMSYVQQGMRADRVPCAPGDADCIEFARGPVQEIENWPSYGDANYSYDAGFWGGNGYVPVSGSFESSTPDSRPDVAAGTGGTETVCGGSRDDQGFGNEACLFVRDPGLVANLQLRLEVGYYFLDWLGVSAFARFQPISGLGTLSFMLVGARVHFRVFDEGQDSGPSVSVHLGGSAGQIQVAVPNNGPSAPYGQSGLGGFHVGTNIGYRFTRNVGIFVNPDFMFQVPEFLFNIDLTLGLEVGF